MAAGFDWRLNPLRSPSVEAVYGLSYVPIAIFGVWGMIMTRARWRELGIIYLLFASFVAVTALFWAHTNHRTHLDVYLIVFSATALTDWRLGRGRLRAGELGLGGADKLLMVVEPWEHYGIPTALVYRSTQPDWRG